VGEVQRLVRGGESFKVCPAVASKLVKVPLEEGEEGGFGVSHYVVHVHVANCDRSWLCRAEWTVGVGEISVLSA